MTDAIERQAAEATAQLAQMKADYESSTERQLERDRAELARLESDPDHLNRQLTSEHARRDVAAVKARIAVAEAATPVVRTDAERLGEILAGKVEVPLIEPLSTVS
jgi:exonuclease VII large subunit